MADRTAAVIEAEITDVRNAISTIIKGGQSYTISTGGSSRTVTNADLDKLRSWLIELQQELNQVNQSYDTPGFIVGASW